MRAAFSVSIFVWLLLGPGGSALGAGDVFWLPPVEAPIVDPFRPPSTPYGPGNRGLEYGTVGGEPVSAVADGTVSYVGVIAGSRFVVVSHTDGLRSTYAYLESSLVVRGQRVRQGQQIATAAAGFHLTARLGDIYIDPALLFAGAEVVVRLVSKEPSTDGGVADGRAQSSGYTRAVGHLAVKS